MRAFNQGSYFRVTMTAPEVYQFARRWPCSGLPFAGISFTFETSNGDLVDTNAPDDADGGAVNALADDAKAYGAARLKLAL